LFIFGKYINKLTPSHGRLEANPLPLKPSIVPWSLVGLAIVLTVVTLTADDGGAATINVDVDWTVDANEGMMSDNTYVMRANLTVTGSGQVSFRRCKFNFMSEENGQYGITVLPGGYLTVHTCILQAGYLSPGQLAKAWTFQVQDSGRLQLQQSTVMDLGYVGAPETGRGLAVASDNVMISNTTFDTCNRGLVVMNGAAPIITDNTFKSSVTGIEVTGSTFSLDRDNEFIENNVGILFMECDEAYLGAGTFESNGVAVQGALSQVHISGVIAGGMGDGFYAEAGTTMVVDNSTVKVLYYRGKAHMGSTLTFINCDNQGWSTFTETDVNSHILVKFSVSFSVRFAGASFPVQGADTELLNAKGSKVYQQVTDSDGLTPVRMVLAFEHHNNQMAITHGPFKAVVSAGFNFEEIEDLQLVANHVITVEFVDDEAPDLMVQLPPQGAFYNTTEVEMKGRVSDMSSGIAAFYFTVDGGENNSLPIQDPWQVWTDLPEGTLVLRFVAVDLLGNEAEEVRTITVDVTPPGLLTTDPPQGSVTRAYQLLLNGTTEPGATLKVQGMAWEVDGNGTFSGYITLGDAEGPEVVDLVLTDTAGNTGSYEYTVMVDRTPPDLDVETDPDYRDFAFINVSDVMVFGTTEPGAAVKVHINAQLVNATVADGLGKWSVHIQLGLGENYLLVDAWDVAGNRASVEVIDFLYDITPPEITLLTPEDGAVFKHKVVSVLVEVRTEEEATVWVNGGESQVQPSHGELEFPDVAIPFDGNNTITIYARDQAGNLATLEIVVWREPKTENGGNDTEGFPIWLVVLALACVAAVVVVAQRLLTRRG